MRSLLLPITLALGLALPVHAATHDPAQDPVRSVSINPEARVSRLAVSASLRPEARDLIIPEGRWGTGGRGMAWSQAAVAALRAHASPLTDFVPADIDSWCPGYRSADRSGREAFWIALISSLAKHESTFRPTVVGGGGRWYGLLQILPSTARSYGCRARTGDALKSGAANIACGLRIMSKTVRRDGVISRGMRGVAADWGPFHNRRKRGDMLAYVQDQPFCKRLPSGLRPVARAHPFVPPADALKDLIPAQPEVSEIITEEG
ncbi:lytic transglycosylase domain-containing protein [Litorisediminicola beolgyonensis]|uniref:Lytic transglycosylase domain-containing protein n=1 Tax=Litorisediminicola beolgyonensis TaxID=1173614 RepID=A0ABW3ZGR7_9RHOB